MRQQSLPQHTVLDTKCVAISVTDTDLSGIEFPLVGEFEVGANGGYVTADGTKVGGFPGRYIKINCGGPGDTTRGER